jgi:hypothetical protein
MSNVDDSVAPESKNGMHLTYTEEKKFRKTNIFTWINQFRVDKGTPCTHTMMSGGCFAIPDDHFPMLVELLSISKDQFSISLTEKHLSDAGPVIIDFDLKFTPSEIDTTRHVITDEQITFVVQLYMKHLHELGITDNSLLTTFSLTRSSGYLTQKEPIIYKDGFHLQMPFLVINYQVQFELRRRVLQDLEHMTPMFFPKITNVLSDVIDEAVIQRNNWLMYGCQKPGLPPYEIRHVYDFDKSGQLIMSVLSSSKYKQLDLIRLLSIRSMECKIITHVNFSCKLEPNSHKFPLKLKSSTSDEKLKLKSKLQVGDVSHGSNPLCVELFQKYHPDTQLVNVKSLSDGLDLYEFTKSAETCLICHRCHHSNRQYIIHNKQSGRIIYKCHDSDAEHKMLYLYSDHDPVIKPDETIHKERVPTYQFHDKKCLMIESNVGTGKTYQLRDFLQNEKIDTRMVIITYRRSLSKKYLDEVGQYGFVSYLDLEQRKIDQPRVIIQLDSLHRLDAGDLDWSVVIIDEIDSVLGQFASPLMENKNDKAQHLEYLLRQSQQTLLMDANLSTCRVGTFVNHLFQREEIHYLKNTYVHPSNRVMHLINEVEGLLTNFMESLKQGHNLVIVSVSRTFLEKVEKMVSQVLTPDQYLFYTGENHNIHEGLNANIVWIGKRVIGYTPYISSGVSFDLEWYDQLYVYGGSGSCDFYTLFQMMFRVRQLRMGQMFMYVNPKRANYPVTYETIEHLLEKTHDEIYHELANCWLYRKIGPSHKYYYPFKDWTYDLYINNLMVHFRSENDFSGELIQLLCQMQIPLIYEDKIDLKVKLTMHNQLVTTKHLIESEKIEKLVTAPLLNTEQYEVLKVQDELTTTEQCSVLKHYCGQVYQIDPHSMTTEFITNYVDRKVVHSYINRCRLNSLNLADQLSQLYKMDLRCSKDLSNTFDYFDEKHESFDLLLCYVFLCQILGLPNLTQQELQKFRLTGQELWNRWSVHLNQIINKIETWTFKLRGNMSKIIKKGTCVHWDNKAFVAFLNSLINHNLGLHFKVSKRNCHDNMQNVYDFGDDFEQLPLQLTIKCSAQHIPEGICLL